MATRKRDTSGIARAKRNAQEQEERRPAWRTSPDAPVGGERASKLVADIAERWAPVLAAVVGAQWGLTVSGTRDGGAVAVTLLAPGGPYKRYCSHFDELATDLEELRVDATNSMAQRVFEAPKLPL